MVGVGSCEESRRGGQAEPLSGAPPPRDRWIFPSNQEVIATCRPWHFGSLWPFGWFKQYFHPLKVSHFWRGIGLGGPVLEVPNREMEDTLEDSYTVTTPCK